MATASQVQTFEEVLADIAAGKIAAANMLATALAQGNIGLFGVDADKARQVAESLAAEFYEIDAPDGTKIRRRQSKRTRAAGARLLITMHRADQSMICNLVAAQQFSVAQGVHGGANGAEVPISEADEDVMDRTRLQLERAKTLANASARKPVGLNGHVNGHANGHATAENG